MLFHNELFYWGCNIILPTITETDLRGHRNLAYKANLKMLIAL